MVTHLRLKMSLNKDERLTVPKRHTPSPTFETAPVVQSVFILIGLLTSIRPQSMKY